MYGLGANASWPSKSVNGKESRPDEMVDLSSFGEVIGGLRIKGYPHVW